MAMVYLKFNSNPGGYIKRTLTGGIRFILTSIFKERGCGERTHMWGGSVHVGAEERTFRIE